MFIEPDNNITIYSKSGCINCLNVKKYLDNAGLSYTIVDCDDYLIEQKEEFLQFIKERANKEYRMFPIVFHNRIFIGGYIETKKYFDNTELEFNDSSF